MEEEIKETPQNKETEGQKILRFKLITRVGEGSFGVAFLAKLYDNVSESLNGRSVVVKIELDEFKKPPFNFSSEFKAARDIG